MPLHLYAFRYKHARTGKWVRARYRAELHRISEEHATFELIGEPEIREPGAGSFNPYRTSRDPHPCASTTSRDNRIAPPSRALADRVDSRDREAKDDT